MKTTKRLILTAAVGCLAVTAISATRKNPEGSKVVGTAEMEQAVKLATDKVNAYLTLRNEVKPATDYKIVAARNLLGKGRQIWVVTFKAGNLIPADPTTQLIGAGGQLIVTVDLKIEESKLTHGE